VQAGEPLWFAGQLEVGEVGSEVTEHGPQLPSGEVGAEAEVLAVSEGEMPVG
jgi:hypothetical protein